MSEDTSPDDTTLRIERLIDAPPETVFDAWTTPTAMEEWYAEGEAGRATVVEYELRVGGAYRVSWSPRPGEEYEEHGTFLEIERPHKLVLSETLAGSGGAGWTDTRVTVTFDAVDGKTRLTLVHENMPSVEARDGAAGGWPGFLDRLERYATKR